MNASNIQNLVLEELQRSPRKHALVKEGLEFLALIDPATALEWVKESVQVYVRDMRAELPEHEHDIVLSWR